MLFSTGESFSNINYEYKDTFIASSHKTIISFEYDCETHQNNPRLNGEKIDHINHWKNTFYYTLEGLERGKQYVFEVKVHQKSKCDPKMDIENGSFLPIELEYFKEGEFKTLSEINVDHFVIEFSLDKINWQVVQYLTPKGSRGGIYQYTTNESGLYRLKEIDRDGYQKEFDPIWVEVERSSGKVIVEIYDYSSKRLDRIVYNKPLIIKYRDGSVSRKMILDR